MKISNMFLLFIVTYFAIIGNEVVIATRISTYQAATRDVFLEKTAAGAADHHVDGKFPWCSWCCNPIVGNACCPNIGGT
ncbi:unnamed protein product [Linum trigynum]|uniref:Uncharacterized protein n=1 Tax=Linum trigynum TaxID=586398 RepID=A0AAV2EG39_9ROSI